MPNPQREFEYTEACNTVDLHPNQRELISGYQNGIVRVWDVKQGKMIHEFVRTLAVA
jgi:G protein beta subunit-like protein